MIAEGPCAQLLARMGVTTEHAEVRVSADFCHLRDG